MSGIVYVKVLVDSLQKKQSALKALLEITKQQEQLLQAEELEENSFLETIRRKQIYIDQITELDSGFEGIYNRVKQELDEDRDKYADDIAIMQNLISLITDLGIGIEALEQRNKVKMDMILSDKKDQVRTKRVNNTAANSYYRNMINQQYSQSYFLDKKK